jgi:NAD(P)-dependent dehydrogenase (short-subunit alcohol dehydrogenase family)
MTKQKVAIVTGGGSGLGLATADRFAKEGYLTIITGRQVEKLQDAQKSIGENCIVMPLDVSDLKGIPLFIADVISKYGRIDVLVNNAGINQKKEIVDVTDEDFENIIRTNQTAVFSLSREVIKQMVQQEEKGNIILISSMAAQYGLPKVISYSAAKTAIDGMTRAMAVELAPKGIRVNAVAPGFIETAMVAKALDSDVDRRDRVMARTPMGKLGKPKDIANAVYFLASEEASYITGVVLRVDGGNAIGF